MRHKQAHVDHWRYIGVLLDILQKGFKLLGTVTVFQYPDFKTVTHTGRVYLDGRPLPCNCL